jgi:two-component system sensor histidine kinase CpxA
LLELARIDSGMAPMDYAPLPLVELLEDIAADADFEARSRQRSVALAVVLETPSEPVTSVTINASPSLLRSAIENVVRNAVRYTAADTQVLIKLTGNAEEALITVSDHGPGVPPAALNKLFQPFYRVSEARDRDGGGTGLGLAITARTVGLLGGTVTARNLPEGGLCIEIRLPLTTQTAQPL